MKDLALAKSISGEVSLYDIDYEAAQNNAYIGNLIYKQNPEMSKWEYKAEKTLEQALTGADCVVISILPGTFKEMESDVHTPEKYGIYQSVGDTVGPGGMLWEYDSPGSQVLSVLVERLSGMSLFDFLNERIFRKLGAFSTATILKNRDGRTALYQRAGG